MKKEYDAVKKKFRDVDHKYGRIAVTEEKLREDFEQVKKDFALAATRLQEMNKARNEAIEELAEEREKMKALNTMLRERDDTIHRYMLDLEQSEKRVELLEKDREMLESKRVTLERQSDMQSHQLNDRINNLNDLVSTEKESREAWIVRFEECQRSVTDLSAELLLVKSENKDMALEKQSLQVKFEAQRKVSDALEVQNAELLEKTSQQGADIENLNRSVLTLRQIYQENEMKVKVTERVAKGEIMQAKRTAEERVRNNEMHAEYLHTLCGDYV